MIRYLTYTITFVSLMFCAALLAETLPGEDKVDILILSGSNNHDWQKTTPLLKSILEESGRFEIEITNQPDTLTYKHLKAFDAIVSNWNPFPENDLRWPRETETGLLKYLEEGGGLVFFHASTSAFYKWPEFKHISAGAWIETTWHDKPGPVKVEIVNQKHPVTKGISDFNIFDELWIDAEQNKSFEVLGTGISTGSSGKRTEKQPAIFVSGYGKGRIFHTILGHDTRAMRNIGFQTLMLRATEWAGTSKVTIPVPGELKKKDLSENFLNIFTNNK